MLAQPTAFVTGASGFLGSHLIRALLSRGYRVHGLVRTTSSLHRLDNLRDRLTLWTGEIEELSDLRSALSAANPTTIYHFAGDTAVRNSAGDWLGLETAIQSGLGGLVNLLRAASEVCPYLKSVVRTGGLEEYGTGPSPFVESQRERPTSPYSFAQTAGTHLAQMLQVHLPFAVTTLRPTLIYGPDQSLDFLIPSLIRTLLEDRDFPLTQGGQRRDLLHVSDFCSAAIQTFGREDLRGIVMNVASGEAHTILEIAAMIANQIGRYDRLQIGALPDRPTEIFDLVGDPGCAHRLLSWRPEIALVDGISATIDWHRKAVNLQI